MIENPQHGFKKFIRGLPETHTRNPQFRMRHTKCDTMMAWHPLASNRKGTRPFFMQGEELESARVRLCRRIPTLDLSTEVSIPNSAMPLSDLVEHMLSNVMHCQSDREVSMLDTVNTLLRTALREPSPVSAGALDRFLQDNIQALMEYWLLERSTEFLHEGMPVAADVFGLRGDTDGCGEALSWLQQRIEMLPGVDPVLTTPDSSDSDSFEMNEAEIETYARGRRLAALIWLHENMSAAYELTREVHTLRLRRMLQAVNASVLPNQRGAYEQSLPRIAAILDKD